MARIIVNSLSLLISVIIFIILISDLTNCDEHLNNTRQFNLLEDDLLGTLKRLPKLLSFHTLEEDINLDMEFTVPFIKIPVNRTTHAMSHLGRGLANINMASIVLTGLVVLASVSFASVLSLGGKFPWNGFKTSREGKLDDVMHPFSFKYRTADGVKEEAYLCDIIDNVEGAFRGYDIDLTACIQKSICSLVQTSYDNVFKGNGTSVNKIIDGFTSSTWLLNMLSGTAIKDAIDAGRRKSGCTIKYRNCKFNEDQITEFFQLLF